MNGIQTSKCYNVAGAQIMNVCNEAALIAVRNNSSVVDMEHFDAAVERVVAGGLVVRFSLINVLTEHSK